MGLNKFGQDPVCVGAIVRPKWEQGHAGEHKTHLPARDEVLCVAGVLDYFPLSFPVRFCSKFNFSFSFYDMLALCPFGGYHFVGHDMFT